MLINNLSKIQGCLFLCMKNMSFHLVWEIKKEEKEEGEMEVEREKE